MLTKVRLYNAKNEWRDIHVGSLGLSGYFSKNIQGLGPVKANVAVSNYVLLDGGVYNSANQGVRNIVIQLGFSPNYAINESVSSMRNVLYDIAAPTEQVRLVIYDDDVAKMQINGVVESNEPEIFSKTPDNQISIVCVEPFFRDMLDSTYDTTTGVNFTIEYLGNKPRGFVVEYTISTNVSYLQIRNRDTGATARVTYPMSAGQILRITTTRGYKSATLNAANGDRIANVIGNLAITDGWPELTRGVNRLVANQNVAPVSPVKILFRNHYQGV